MKANGDSDDQIKQAIQELQLKSIEKYGNRSKVGLQLESQNRELLEQNVIKNELSNRKHKTRVASEFNKSKIAKLRNRGDRVSLAGSSYATFQTDNS